MRWGSVGLSGVALAVLLIALAPLSSPAARAQTLFASPSEGPVGTVISLMGMGFDANAGVTVQFMQPGFSQIVGTGTTSGQGNFGIPVMIPNGASVGPATIQASTAGHSQTTTFVVTGTDATPTGTAVATATPTPSRTATGTATASVTGTATATATALPTSTLPIAETPSTATATPTPTLQNLPDLVITKSVLDVGLRLKRFVLRVENIGTASALFVKVIDVVDLEVALADYVKQSNNFGCIRKSAQMLECTILSLPPGGVEEIELTAVGATADCKGRPNVAAVDPDDQIAELREDNNHAEVEYSLCNSTPTPTSTTPNPTATSTPTATPSPTLVPGETCEVSLTLVSIQVFDDTEIGQEEWRIFTESTTPSVAAFIEVSADVGEGEVAINHTFPGRRLLPRSVFPLFASVVVRVEELDDVFNERSGDLSGGARGLPCPGSRTLHLSVHGEGPDAFPEDFDVLLTYRWDVRRF